MITPEMYNELRIQEQQGQEMADDLKKKKEKKNNDSWYRYNGNEKRLR